MQTPRLCIDGRLAGELSFRGALAQEVIDQLVAAAGEVETGSPWIEKHRTVLLTHPGQLFSGQLKRYDTRLKISGTPWHWAWEKLFVREAKLSAFHRFRPIDRLSPNHECATLTTLLPPRRGIPFLIPHKPGQKYAVPSEKDAKILQKTFGVPTDSVFVVRPSARRCVHFMEQPATVPHAWLLFLVATDKAARKAERTIDIISSRFPQLPKKVLTLSKREEFLPEAWRKTLQSTKACFYLSEEVCDWPTLALETFYWGVPTVFADGNAALAELLPESDLRVSRFLIESPDMTEIRTKGQVAREILQRAGVFEPLSLAKQYREVYEKLN